jgi:hypothetical protein
LWPYCLIAFQWLSIHDGDISSTNLSATAQGQIRGFNEECNRSLFQAAHLGPLTLQGVFAADAQLMELAFCQNTTAWWSVVVKMQDTQPYITNLEECLYLKGPPIEKLFLPMFK